MADTFTSPLHPSKVPAGSVTGTWVAIFFSTWLALVLVLGERGVFNAPRGAPPLALLLGLVVPLGAFLVGYRTLAPLREFVLKADLRVIAGIQAWRWAGIGFLTLSTYGILPRVFAWPAGLGDMSIGLTAPMVLAGLLRDPDSASGNRFIAWNLAGILDLVVAVSLGALVPLLAPSLYGTVSNAAMAQLPLVLIPTFLVPTFLMLHLTALFQVQRRRKTLRSSG